MCILISFCVFGAIYKHFLKKHNLINLKNKDEKFAKLCLQFLIYSSSHEYENFFSTLLSAKQVAKNLFESSDIFFYINIKTPLSKNNFFSAHNFYLSSNPNKKLAFIYTSLEDGFKEILSNSPIKYETYSWIELYEYMKEKKLFPINKPLEKTKNINLKNIKTSLSQNITKHKFKEFFFSGLSSGLQDSGFRVRITANA